MSTNLEEDKNIKRLKRELESLGLKKFWIRNNSLFSKMRKTIARAKTAKNKKAKGN